MSARDKYNPNHVSPDLSPPKEEISRTDFDKTFIAGTPKDVSEQISELQNIGVKNLMVKINIGEMDQKIVFRTMELLANHVRPYFLD